MSQPAIASETQRHPGGEALGALLAQTGWARGRSADALEAMAAAGGPFVALWDGERLVGYARALSDGVYRALLEDVIVDEAYRGRGLGDRLIRELVTQLEGVEEIFLNTRPHLIAFYERFGFKRFDGVTMNCPGV
jgi:ribosomal protein S18 acetylase RimI-like enzyme